MISVGASSVFLRFRGARVLAPLLLVGVLTACGLFKPEDHFGARQLTYQQLDGWWTDDHAKALQVFLQSCPILAAKARPESSGSNLRISESVWKSLCDEAMTVVPGDKDAARDFFERRFIPFRVNNNGEEKGLFTGYYEPVLYGSWKKKGDYKYPLYLPPPELKKGSPYFTHAEINGGALNGRKLELLWVDDPVMLFFMQIQGSGRVVFANGTEIQIGYAGQNGQTYESLGKLAGDEGWIPKDQINFFTLRQWLYDHPERAIDAMEKNPSYVFFKRLEKTGAVGAVGATLTPQRSLAVDSRYIPYGLPLFLETDLPGLNEESARPLRQLMLAQDTGGAIKGPVRGDIFFGPGQEAEYLAGYMKGRGVYSLLVPKEAIYQLQ